MDFKMPTQEVEIGPDGPHSETKEGCLPTHLTPFYNKRNNGVHGPRKNGMGHPSQTSTHPDQVTKGNKINGLFLQRSSNVNLTLNTRVIQDALKRGGRKSMEH